MAEPLSATFIGPDLSALTAAVLDAVPYTNKLPDKMDVKWVDKKPSADWREKLLEVDGMTVAWGDMAVSRDPGMVTADFPIAWRPEVILKTLASLPFELVKLSATDVWTKADYKAPSIAGTRLGWAMIVKGDAHERYFAARRWLEQGPYRTLTGAHDTTFLQFCDDPNDPKSVDQARPGHDWVEAGFIKPKHRYKHDIKGVKKGDRLLRIVINSRELSDDELLDACAARRDDDAIDNIAYVFVDEAEAKSNLERLWLRELECRYAGPSGESRLDDSFQRKLEKPTWT